MSLIRWNFDKNFIYVIIYWVIEISIRILSSLKPEFFKLSKDTVNNEYIFVILNFLADLLAGFLVLYSNCKSKSKNINNEALITKSHSDLIYTKLDKLKKKFYIKLIVIVVLNYISRSRKWISYAITRADPEEISHTFKNNIKISLDIIIRYLLSDFFLKVKVYRHHFFSTFTIDIGFVLLIINDIVLMCCGKVDYDLVNTMIFTGIASISGVICPIQDTFLKQIFTEDYLYPVNYQFYRGIAESILIAVITPILYFSFHIEPSFNRDNLNIVIPSIIIHTFSSFVKSFILIKIVYHYSFQSVSFLLISHSFGCSITRFIETFKKGIDDKWKIIFIFLEIISILIILFASLVYDEIIIINKWRLNENVKLGIINRGELDTFEMNIRNDSELDANQSVDNDSNKRHTSIKDYNKNNVNK